MRHQDYNKSTSQSRCSILQHSKARKQSNDQSIDQLTENQSVATVLYVNNAKMLNIVLAALNMIPLIFWGLDCYFYIILYF